VSGAVQAPTFVCHGCGAVVDPARAFPFACPNARAGDEIDHVLVAPIDARQPPEGGEDNPFLRYRRWLTPYRLARAVGLSDAAWIDLVGQLDLQLQAIDGRGFRVTPMARQPALAAALGLAGDLWIKDETRNVSGSHKGRHLAGVMLYLNVLAASGLPLGQGLRRRRLAISSCGNAALAAAVIARAADWPLDVFIPIDAEPSVVRRLGELGARVVICERRDGEAGDPCVRAARAAVAAGAIPFSVQGPDNGLAVEGARTLAFEMAETLAAVGAEVETLFIQVGGGGFASALAQGFAIAAAAGLAKRAPRLVAVQTAGCAPLERAWRRLADADLQQAAQHRSQFMWPWESAPASLAHGILDDETYDWWEVVRAMRATGGEPIVADEAAIAQALSLARAHTAIPVSATGAAGLAGALAARPAGGSAAAVFSGVER
jgi:threonine synthase